MFVFGFSDKPSHGFNVITIITEEMIRTSLNVNTCRQRTLKNRHDSCRIPEPIILCLVNPSIAKSVHWVSCLCLSLPSFDSSRISLFSQVMLYTVVIII